MRKLAAVMEKTAAAKARKSTQRNATQRSKTLAAFFRS